MSEERQRGTRCSLSDDLFRIVSTSISIYDSAITLLGEPPVNGVEMPGPAHIACMRNILSSLGIGEQEDEDEFFA